MQIGPFTVSRGTMIPYVEDDRTSQVRKVAGDGSITVVEQGFASELFFRAKIKVPRDEGTKIRDFLLAKGYASETFTYIDGFGTSFTVRFWDRRVRRRNIGGSLVELDLLFRQEIAAP